MSVRNKNATLIATAIVLRSFSVLGWDDFGAFVEVQQTRAVWFDVPNGRLSGCVIIAP